VTADTNAVQAVCATSNGSFFFSAGDAGAGLTLGRLVSVGFEFTTVTAAEAFEERACVKDKSAATANAAAAVVTKIPATIHRMAGLKLCYAL
jgi:hypothetical protein